jgi:hypothetical protein
MQKHRLISLTKVLAILTFVVLALVLPNGLEAHQYGIARLGFFYLASSQRFAATSGADP